MACKLCKRLKLKKLRRLDEKIEEGKVSVFELSKEFDVPTKAILTHIDRCIAPKEKSGYQTLQDLLANVVKDLEEARQDVKYGGGSDEDGGGTDKGAVFLYTSLLREAREIVSTLERLKPNEAIGKEIQGVAVAPFVTEMARVLIEEGSSMKTALQAILGENYTKDVDRAIKDAWKRMTQRINQEYRFVDSRISSVLSGQTQSKKPAKSKASSDSQSSSDQLH